MASSQKRSTQIKLTITPETHQRLRDLAERLGQSPATIASFAVSTYVAQQAATLSAGENAVKGLIAELGDPIKQLLAKMAAEGSE